MPLATIRPAMLAKVGLARAWRAFLTSTAVL
jgi:hypothetical protein